MCSSLIYILHTVPESGSEETQKQKRSSKRTSKVAATTSSEEQSTNGKLKSRLCLSYNKHYSSLLPDSVGADELELGMLILPL